MENNLNEEDFISEEDKKKYLENINLFLDKLKKINIIYDYTDENANIAEKIERINIINQLKLIPLDEDLFVKIILPNISFTISVIKNNIFTECDFLNDNGKRRKIFENITNVYNFFYNIIENKECTMDDLKPLINLDFITKLIYLFNSSIYEEREELKVILHRLYSKMVCKRKMIRKQLISIFKSIIEKEHNFNGITELLDVIISFVSGFAIPLRDEHISFFKEIIIPLHYLDSYKKFNLYLRDCALKFMIKEKKLIILLLEGILSHWPFKDNKKQKLLYEEIKEIIKISDINTIEPIFEQLIKTIIECMSMDNISVVESAIFFLNDPLLIPLIEKNKKSFVRLIAPTIKYFSINHWHPKIKLKFQQLNEKIKKNDEHIYNEALNDKGNKIELWPKNSQDEENQLQLAIKLSKEIIEKNKNINELNNYIYDLNINEEEEFDEEYRELAKITTLGVIVVGGLGYIMVGLGALLGI